MTSRVGQDLEDGGRWRLNAVWIPRRACVRLAWSSPHRVAEVQRPLALDDGRVLEDDMASDELAEVADACPEQHGHQADVDLVDEAEVQGLLDDVGAGDGGELVASKVLRRGDCVFDAAGEGGPGEALADALRRRPVGDDDDRSAGRVVVTPTVGLVE